MSTSEAGDEVALAEAARGLVATPPLRAAPDCALLVEAGADISVFQAEPVLAPVSVAPATTLELEAEPLLFVPLPALTNTAEAPDEDCDCFDFKLMVLPDVTRAVFAMLASSDESVAARIAFIDPLRVIEVLHVPTWAFRKKEGGRSAFNCRGEWVSFVDLGGREASLMTTTWMKPELSDVGAFARTQFAQTSSASADAWVLHSMKNGLSTTL